MKQILILCILLVNLLACTQNYSIIEDSKQTYEGIVIDRTIDKNKAYISIRIENGNELLFWAQSEETIPNEISINDRVQIESGIDESTKELIAIIVKEIE